MGIDVWFLAHARVSSKPHKKLKMDDTMTFFHQLATLVDAGTPLLQALQIAGSQSESLALAAGPESRSPTRSRPGAPSTPAAAGYPKIFEHAWVEVIRTGEVTGKMAHVLKELSRQVRESRETKRKIKGALMYPCIMLIVATLAITAMLMFVVPTFDRMFKDMGAELPAITQFVVNASGFIVTNGPYIGAAIAALAFGARAYLRTETGRYWFTTVMHRLADIR